MWKYTLPILLLVACTQAPAPTAAPTATQAPVPVPAPVPAAAPAAPAEPTTRYTILGTLDWRSECPAPMPSEIEIFITLANDQHQVTLPPKRMGMMGASYRIIVPWNDSWGKPTEWRNLRITKFNKESVCGSSCPSGHCVDTTPFAPVAAVTDGDRISGGSATITCSCQQ